MPDTHTYSQSPNPDGIPAQTFNFAVPFHFDSMPTPHTVSVSFEGTAVKEIMISDMDGRTVQRISPEPSSTNATFSVSGIPDGIYMIRLQTAQGIVTRSLW